MNFLEVKMQNRKLAKEYKANYRRNTFENKKEVVLFRSKINDNIIVHLASNLDISKNDGDKEYECVFYHRNESIYEIIIPYEILHGEYHQDDKHISISDLDGNSYCIDDKNLVIKTKDYNFNKKAISEEIEKYIESELNER